MTSGKDRAPGVYDSIFDERILFPAFRLAIDRFAHASRGGALRRIDEPSSTFSREKTDAN